MAQQSLAQSYDFESQLELGEMLLNLGRIEEASSELKKAKDLNEIGAYTTDDSDPKRQTDLRRLAQALSRVEELQSTSDSASRIWWYLAGALMLGLAGIVFFVWALNRNELIEIRAQATSDAQVIQAARDQELASLNQLLVEVTRQSDQIVDLYSENSQLVYGGTRIAEAMQVAQESANSAERAALMIESQLLTQEAQSTQVSAEAVNVASATEVPAVVVADETPLPTEVPPTPLPDNLLGETIDQLRVDAFSANLRQGPGFNYFVIGSIKRGTTVQVLAKSPDTYWYNVETEDGLNAWLHSSVAKPLSIDWLPVASTIPAPPFVEPTAAPTLRPAPTNTPVPPTPIPPSPVPPTAVPTEVPVEQVEEASTGETEGATEEQAVEEPTEEPIVVPTEVPAEVPTEEAGNDDGADTGASPLVVQESTVTLTIDANEILNTFLATRTPEIDTGPGFPVILVTQTSSP